MRDWDTYLLVLTMALVSIWTTTRADEVARIARHGQHYAQPTAAEVCVYVNVAKATAPFVNMLFEHCPPYSTVLLSPGVLHVDQYLNLGDKHMTLSGSPTTLDFTGQAAAIELIPPDR